MDKELESKYFVVIPRNVLNNNQYISPRFKGRNVLEAGALVLVFILIQAGLSLSGTALAIYVAIGLGAAFFAFIGINRVSLTQYLTYVIKFNRNKRILSEPGREYDKKRDRASLRKEI